MEDKGEPAVSSPAFIGGVAMSQLLLEIPGDGEVSDPPVTDASPGLS